MLNDKAAGSAQSLGGGGKKKMHILVLDAM